MMLWSFLISVFYIIFIKMLFTNNTWQDFRKPFTDMIFRCNVWFIGRYDCLAVFRKVIVASIDIHEILPHLPFVGKCISSMFTSYQIWFPFIYVYSHCISHNVMLKLWYIKALPTRTDKLCCNSCAHYLNDNLQL